MTIKTDIRTEYTAADLTALEQLLITAFTDATPATLTPRQAWMAFELLNHGAVSAIVAAQMPEVLGSAFKGHFFHELDRAYNDVLPADWRDLTRPLDA